MSSFSIEVIFCLSSLLIIYTYIIYPMFLWFLRRKRIFSETGNIVMPRVSLVVCAYNEEKVIREKIENCLTLNYPKEKLEIIIASDGSDDSTDIIADEFNSETRHIRYELRAGKINVLNKTIPQAEGEIVVLSDANTIYDRDAIYKLVQKFQDDKVGCVCGKLVLKAPDDAKGGELEGVYWKYENFIKEMEGEHGALLGANGGIYAFRKELFRPLRSDTIVEDFVIPISILAEGYKVVFEPEAIGYEYTCSDIREEHLRKIRIGAGNYQALFRNPGMLNLFKGFPSLAYWSHKVMRWMVPFLMIVILISNILLLKQKLYLYIGIMQACLYIGVGLEYFSGKKVTRSKFFHFLYYFVSMNWCLLVGFWKFIAGTQRVTWQRTGR